MKYISKIKVPGTTAEKVQNEWDWGCKTGQTGCCELEINKKYTTWLQIGASLFKVIWNSLIFFGQLTSYYRCQKENDKWYNCNIYFNDI